MRRLIALLATTGAVTLPTTIPDSINEPGNHPADPPERPVLVEHVPDRLGWAEDDERSTAADRESVAITVT